MAKVTVALVFCLVTYPVVAEQESQKSDGIFEFLFEEQASMFDLGVHRLEHRHSLWRLDLAKAIQGRDSLSTYYLSTEQDGVGFDHYSNTIEIRFALVGNPQPKLCAEFLNISQLVISPQVDLGENFTGTDRDRWQVKAREYEFAKSFAPAGVTDEHYPENWQHLLTNNTHIVISIVEAQPTDPDRAFKRGIACFMSIHGNEVLHQFEMQLPVE